MPDRSLRNLSVAEQRRAMALWRQRADAALRAAKQSDRSPRRQIEMGLAAEPWQPSSLPPPRERGRLARCVNAMSEPRNRGYNDALRRLLFALVEYDSPMLGDYQYVSAMKPLAKLYARWVRPPEEWKPRTHNVGRQFSSLLRHLLAHYAVPRVFDVTVLEGNPAQIEWFIHVGGGKNLRKAPALPYPLTKMMAHHALLAPDDVPGGAPGGLRWGQVRGLGGSTRLATAVCATAMARPMPDEPFWLTVVQFFVNNPMLDPAQVRPIVDFIFDQRFVAGAGRIVNGVHEGGGIPQPNLSMKGRTVESVLRQMEQWHRRLARLPKAGQAARRWLPSGIQPYNRVEGVPGNQRMFVTVEMLDEAELRDEGRAMRHCVASYAASCATGRCAIFSLREDDGGGQVRRLTVEVNVQNRRILQARGRYNAKPDGVDERVLRAWGTAAGLSVPPMNRM